MTNQERTRWKTWADSLRQKMMTGLTAEVTKSVDDIISETASTKAQSTLRSAKFWEACQSGTSPSDFLTSAGFEIEFEQDEKRNVQKVNLRLNQTWMTILDGVLERKGV